MTTPLLVTKLRPPPIRGTTVSRSRLLLRLDEGHRRALTLVAAPAGYGKSTLVAEWVSALEVPWVWLSLDVTDNDPAQFLTYLAAALGSIAPRIPEAMASLLHGGLRQAALEASAALLVNELATLDLPVTVVLDDYHVITDPMTHQVLTFLLDHRPATLHVAILTRQDPPLPLSRLRARGQLAELRAADLRFTREEAGRFFADVMALSLDEAAVATLEARTEGWVAGLQLAAVALNAGPDDDQARTAFVSDFGGSHRYVIDYLMDEVLQRRPPDVRDFLLRTSILDRLSAPLCAAVLGEGPPDPEPNRDEIDAAQALLEHLEATNLFLLPLDGRRTWYRYHRLFADVLRANLEPGVARTLHRRAAQWYAAEGQWAEAIGHALAGDDAERAAAWMEQVADERLHAGHFVTLLNWIRPLPEATVLKHGPLLAAEAVALVLTGQPAPLKARLATLDRVKPSLSTRTQGRLLAARAWLASMESDASAATLAREALPLLDAKADSLYRILALIPLSSAIAVTHDLGTATSLLEEAYRLAEAIDQPLAALATLANLAFLMHEQGRRREAIRLCEEALSRYVDAQGDPLPVAGLAYLPLASLAYAGHDPQRAERAARQGLALCGQLFSETALGGDAERVLAYVLADRGEWDAAYAVLEDARQAALQRGIAHMAGIMAAAAAALDLRAGKIDRVGQWATDSGYASADPRRIPEYAWFSFVGLLLARAQWERAGALLQGRTADLEAQGRHGRLVYTRLLFARVALGLGDRDHAVACVRQALAFAATQGYRQAFLSATPEVQALLPQCRDAAPAFVDELLALITPGRPAAANGAALASDREAANAALIEPLTERELEVLDLIAAGLTNREIAAQLYVTEGTVKRHGYNLYGKLGVNSRTQAIARAREVGIL